MEKSISKYKELLAYPLQPLFYKRFVDDGFGIWTHSQEQLEMFLEYANNIKQRKDWIRRHNGKPKPRQKFKNRC